MSEKYKFSTTDGIYFTTSSIVGWVDLFTRNDYCEIVLNSLKHCQQKKGLVIHAWCIMPSHLHMIISKKGKDELSAIMRDFKKFTAMEIIRCIQHINESRREWMLNLFKAEGAPLKRITNYKVWQDGNHPQVLDSASLMEQKLDYIHNNPVKEGYVWEPNDWLMSSATDYWGEQGYLKLEMLK